MTVDASIYQEFYEVLKNEFIQRELEGNSMKGRGRDTPQLWLHQDKKTKQVRASELFGGSRTSNPQYFYRKHIEFQPGKTSRGEIDAVAFAKGLKYIGMTIPETSRQGKKMNAEDEARLLLEEFIARYSPSGKNISNSLPGNSLPGIEEDKHISVKKALTLINSFYGHISASQYKPAWDLLTTGIQGRLWKDDMGKFAEGYAFTLGIRNIHVFQAVLTSPASVDCQVYYEDETSSYPLRQLKDSRNLTVTDVESFMQVVKELKTKFEGLGYEGIGNIELFRLFDPTVSDYIRYKCGIDESEMEKIFSEPIPVFTKRLYFITCRLAGDKWLIERIADVKTWTFR